MKKIHFTLGCLALLTGTAFGQGATIASWDFNTDQSSQFTVQQFGNDYVANFNYDYGTYAVTAPTVGPAPIPAAPGGTGTKGLRLEANHNDATAAAAAVSVFPNLAAPLSNYIMTFDLWVNYNGGVGGATGSTEFVEVGAHSNALQAEYPGGAGTGFFFMWSGEGGAAQDAR